MPEILESLRSRRALVLEAPPGAGKSTRVPIALVNAGLTGAGQVLVTEPRRIAARMLARRVAAERGERLGQSIGYQVRFERVAGPETRVLYVTDGILLRRLVNDPILDGVSAVILDEFHERSLDSDLCLALLARLKEEDRPDLCLVVMSATLEAGPVADFLGGCPRLSSAGRRFDVSIEHQARPDERPLEKQILGATRQLLLAEAEGDVLVFLPGAREIRRALEALLPLSAEHGLDVLPLHGDLPIAEQARAIEPGPRRKVVLSTNVAESSLTLEGVTSVVDSGLFRQARHSPFSGFSALTTAKVSQASAAQRAGRAGRTRPGRVLRLYTKGDLDARPAQDAPEVLRADLTGALLSLHGSGVKNVGELRFLTPPPDASLKAAEALLDLLGALETSKALSPIGRRLLSLSVHPRLGRILIEGERRGVGAQAALVAALIEERDLRLSARAELGDRRGRRDTSTGPSDLFALMDAFELAESLSFEPHRLRAHGIDPQAARAVERSRSALLGRRPESASPTSPEALEETLLRVILTGFVDRLARRRRPDAPDLVLCNGRVARLADESVVRSHPLMVAIAIDEAGSGPTTAPATVRLASGVEPEWLLEEYPERLELTEGLVWNQESQRVEQQSRLGFGAVTLEQSQRAARPGPGATALLRTAMQGPGAQEFLRNDELSEALERLRLIDDDPEVDRSRLEERVLSLAEGLTSFAELRALHPIATLLATLDPATRRRLEEQAPLSIRLVGGRSLRVHYPSGRPPFVESRLQDFFGMAEGPRIAKGRVPLTLHLNAPNGRAVQVTTDLAGFWERHYPTIRRELMRRYPRHPWPEDGRTAEPPRPGRRRG